MRNLKEWMEKNPEAVQWLKEGACLADLKNFGFDCGDMGPWSIYAIRLYAGMTGRIKASDRLMLRRYPAAVKYAKRGLKYDEVADKAGCGRTTYHRLKWILKRGERQERFRNTYLNLRRK